MWESTSGGSNKERSSLREGCTSLVRRKVFSSYETKPSNDDLSRTAPFQPPWTKLSDKLFFRVLATSWDTFRSWKFSLLETKLSIVENDCTYLPACVIREIFQSILSGFTAGCLIPHNKEICLV